MVTPWHHLTQLPHRAVRDSGRTDESAEGRTIDAENDRLVTRDVYRTNRVAVVENIGGVSTGNAAGCTRPLPAMRFEPVTHTVRVAVEFPGVAEKMVVVVPGPVV